jgi:CheY-like chemotaxis protein
MLERPAAVEAQGSVREPLRILLAEDNPISQKVTQMMLARLGHRVDTVSNGLEAVDAVRRGTYDVVLMDVQMPDLDGLAATRRIRSEIPAGRQPTIVAVTASTHVEDHAACGMAGMDAHIAKPMRPQALRAVLGSARGRTAERDPSGSRTPTETGASAPTDSGSSDDREAAVRTRLTELTGPDADDDGLLGALLRSFVTRAPQLLDQLDRAVAEGSADQVERVAHALRGAADNIGGGELARQLRHVETLAGAGELPAGEVLQRVRDEQNLLRAILTTIARQMESGLTPLTGRAAGF